MVIGVLEAGFSGAAVEIVLKTGQAFYGLIGQGAESHRPIGKLPDEDAFLANLDHVPVPWVRLDHGKPLEELLIRSFQDLDETTVTVEKSPGQPEPKVVHAGRGRHLTVGVSARVSLLFDRAH